MLEAGAALDWHNAPSTRCLTDLIIRTGFKNAAGEYVTKKIYDWLSSQQSDNTVNFETITNVIEEFLQYWAVSDKEHINGLAYFAGQQDVRWGGFIHYKINEHDTTYTISIPNGGDAINSRGQSVHNNITPNAKYFELLLSELLDAVVSQVSRYSYCSHTKQDAIENEDNEEINRLAVSFFQQIEQNNILRIYSLNYDKIIQYLFNKLGLSVFQGFDTEKVFPLHTEAVPVSRLKILQDRDSHCIYHLHGNASWQIRNKNSNGLDSYEYFLTPFEHLSFNERFAILSLEKEKPLFISNLITGFQKSQRTSLSPFRQMMASFDRDCLSGDELVIIGYSFGDEHVNDVIRQARKENGTLKITIVSPDFDKRNFADKFISHWGTFMDFIFEKNGEHVEISRQYNVEVFNVGFKEYLESILNEKPN